MPEYHADDIDDSDTESLYGYDNAWSGGRSPNKSQVESIHTSWNGSKVYAQTGVIPGQGDDDEGVKSNHHGIESRVSLSFLDNKWRFYTVSDDESASLSSFQAVIFMIHALLSSGGFLAIPFAATRLASASTAIGLLAAVGFLAYYSAMCMGYAVDEAIMTALGDENYTRLTDLGKSSGHRRVFSAVMFIESWVTSIAFFILEMHILSIFFPSSSGVTTNALVGGLFAVITLTSFFDIMPRWMTRLSTMGIFLALALCVYAGLGLVEQGFLQSRNNINNNTAETTLVDVPDPLFSTVVSIAMSISIFTYCFSSHSVVPQVKASMVHSSDSSFTVVMAISHLFVFAVYATIAALSLLLLSSTPASYPGDATSTTLGESGITMKLLLDSIVSYGNRHGVTYAWLVNGLIGLLGLWFITNHGDIIKQCVRLAGCNPEHVRDQYAHYSPGHRASFIKHLAVKYVGSLLVIMSSVTIAVLVPHFAWTIATFAAFSCVVLVFVIPPNIYMQICHHDIPSFDREVNGEGLTALSLFLNWALMVSACIIGVLAAFQGGVYMVKFACIDCLTKLFMF